MSRSIRLGELNVVGDRVQFTPDDHGEIKARRGEQLSISLPFRTEEVSPDREEWRIGVTIELDGKQLPAVDTIVKDRPGVHDVRKGALFTVVTPRNAGKFEVAYRIDVDYESRPWEGGDAETWKEKREGRLTLHIE